VTLPPILNAANVIPIANYAAQQPKPVLCVTILTLMVCILIQGQILVLGLATRDSGAMQLLNGTLFALHVIHLYVKSAAHPPQLVLNVTKWVFLAVVYRVDHRSPLLTEVILRIADLHQRSVQNLSQETAATRKG
jgi:hypothetical protein